MTDRIEETIPEYVKVAKRSDLCGNRRLLLSVEGTDVLLLSVDGRVYAVNNVCPHQHFSALHQGPLQGLELTCPMHGSTYNVETGKAVGDGGVLTCYAVRFDGDDIEIERPKPKL